MITTLCMLLPSLFAASERGVTANIPTLQVETVKPAVLEPYQGMPYESPRMFLAEDKSGDIIPACSAAVVKFNYAQEKLGYMPPDLGVSGTILQAVESAPKWLQPALLDNLRRSWNAETFAQVILDADPQYRDEIAFQVAHLAPKSLNRVKAQLLKENATYIYEIAPDLKYVELVEGGDPATSDWYTTTRYRVADGGDTTWVEIPKEIYYWWVVMPKLSDEEPLMDASVYNEFWRQHLYYTADDGYPLLKDALADVEVMWDCDAHRWDNKDAEGNMYAYGDSLFAVQAVGRWANQTLPEKAQPPRPNQPNQLLHDHNGNCGELQDLLNAGARTALLPVLSVSSWPGDHVWNELYWNGEWWFYQDSWACGGTILSQDQGFPKKGLISGWRGDVYRWMVNEHYNPVCTLTVKVNDSDGRPIDGAQVTFFSASYSDPHASQYYLGSWGYTDENGELTVLLGESITYGLRADWAEGHDPPQSNQIYGISWEQVQEGGHLQTTLQPGGSMPDEIPVNEISGTPLDHYKLQVNYEAPYRILYGDGYWEQSFSLDDYEWGDFRSTGDVNFFVCDEANYENYLSGSAFDAYEVTENSSNGSVEFSLPEDENFYTVFSNKEKSITSQLLQATVYLYKKNGDWVLIDSVKTEGEDIEEVAITAPPIFLELSPNPATSRLEITYATPYPGNIELAVYDAVGRKVNTLIKGNSPVGNHRLLWDLRDSEGNRVGEGIYFLRLDTGKFHVTGKVVIIGG